MARAIYTNWRSINDWWMDYVIFTDAKIKKRTLMRNLVTAGLIFIAACNPSKKAGSGIVIYNNEISHEFMFELFESEILKRNRDKNIDNILK